MAEAKKSTAKNTQKTGGVKQAATSTKRKASTGKKTKTKKVKLVKVDEKKQVVETTKVVKKQEQVVTARMKRLSEKAADRAQRTDGKKADPEFVASMKLTEIDSMIYTQEEYEGLLEMYDSTIKDIKEGQIVAGKVLGVSRDDVIVDVGFKSEGLIAISEFPEPINIAVGDNIEVYLEQIEDQNGQLILSKSKADFMKVWDNIKGVHDSGELIIGKLARRIKGGMIVDINGVDAFLPGSQISLRQVPDFDALIGQKMEFKIIKLNRNRRNIVVSRRVVLEEEREEKRSHLLKEIAVGQVRDGIVKNITDFGVFIDL
ncbi:MAG: S1 RNA-binding domain-containing protein, partial [candidate division Zixibacteria bacterium]|nr:S1 RNA-binding domain-containing protein [candidate division Zixibacteria bacterium]